MDFRGVDIPSGSMRQYSVLQYLQEAARCVDGGTDLASEVDTTTGKMCSHLCI